MGTTTNRGLPYPEATSPSNQLATRIKELAVDVDAKLLMPAVRYVITTAQAVPNGTWYAVNAWSPKTSNVRIPYNGTDIFTILDAGVYALDFTAMFRSDVSSSGYRAARILFDPGTGFDELSGTYTPPIAGQIAHTTCKTSAIATLPANTKIQPVVYQTSGGAVNLHTSPWTQICIARLT